MNKSNESFSRLKAVQWTLFTERTVQVIRISQINLDGPGAKWLSWVKVPWKNFGKSHKQYLTNSVDMDIIYRSRSTIVFTNNIC